MTVTENLGLKKPGGSDKVLISDLNTNADKLDEIIGKLSELDTSQKNSLVAAINAALLDTSESAAAAAASAAAAEQSETAAAGSAAAAASSATAAATAKTAAETAKTDAVAAKTAAESASASATESKTAAASSAATATEKATAAADSATAAASSAAAAQQSADSAAAAVTGAVKYNAAQTLADEQKSQAKTNIGLGNVDNTSDEDKPISTAMQTALNAKQGKLTAGQGISLSGNTIDTKVYPCNPNLLDNWYFGNPVNQRGQTSYTGAVYGIDRWKGESDTTVTVANNGVTIAASSSYGILQKHENPSEVNGKLATISILTAGGSLSKLTLTIGSYAGGGNIGDIRAYSTTDTMLYLRVKSGGTSVTILAVKLELGSEQTLAHQDANGNWVLNEIPDYGEQLARCQRYYQIYSSASARPTLAVDCRPVMRADPARSTITIGSTTYYANSADL